LLFDVQLAEGFGDQDRRVFRCVFLRTPAYEWSRSMAFTCADAAMRPRFT
jgi:hypothetical protein